MKLDRFLKTWEGTQWENLAHRVILAVLAFAILLLSLKTFTKETIVTVQPFTLSQEAWVSKDDSSRSYQESWGLALALLLGNITPGNVDFVEERIKPLLGSEIYQDAIDIIHLQATEIKNDRISIRFEPRFVDYEKSTGKVFVTGHSFAQGPTSTKPKRKEKTYEFIINISNYLPEIAFIDLYEGKARTEKVLQQIKRKEESQG